MAHTAAVAMVTPSAHEASTGSSPPYRQGAIEDQEAGEGNQYPGELAEMGRDPGIAVGVLGEDDRMIVPVA